MNEFDDFDTQWQCEDIYLGELLDDLLDDDLLAYRDRHCEVRGEHEDIRDYGD